MENVTQETAVQMKKRHQEEVNSFEGLFFAFSNKQLEEGFKKVGATKDNKVISIGAGGYLLKNRLKDFEAMFDRHKKETKSMRESQKTIDITFKGIDGWNRVVFKSIEKPYRFYGCTSILFDYDDTEETILNKINEDDLTYFGSYFDCEPAGTIAGNIKIVKKF